MGFDTGRTTVPLAYWARGFVGIHRTEPLRLKEHPEMLTATETNRASALLMAGLILDAVMAGSVEAEQNWTYVVPGEGEASAHPPWRALPVGDKPPDGLSENVSYRGDRQYYAQFRFGSTDSIRLAVVLDELSSGESMLYVDADRDRTIEPTDLVPGTRNTWRVPLEAVVAHDEPPATTSRRVMLLRLGTVIRVLSVAEAGYLEGQAKVDGRNVTARRVDANANGLFSDVQDRIWLDLDGDGLWDPLAERFSVRPVFDLPSGRYAVAADLFGRSLTLKKLEGTGTLVLAGAPRTAGASVLDITATLVGGDGATFALKGNGTQVTAPVGEYRLHSLVVTARESDERLPWEFVFTHPGNREYRWFDLARNSTVEVNPLDRLILDVEGVDERCQPGQSISVRPRVYTGDGLLINTCILHSAGRSSDMNASCALVELSSSDGKPLSSATSGFR
jgi:hypothetical protein